MALPKIDNPTYTLELPSTGEVVKYRPFLVKEQKILMMAQQSDKTVDRNDAILQIILLTVVERFSHSQMRHFFFFSSIAS